MVQKRESIFTRVLVGNKVKEKLAFLDNFPEETHGIELELMDLKEELKATEEAMLGIRANKMNEAWGQCEKLKVAGKGSNNAKDREVMTDKLLKKDTAYTQLIQQKGATENFIMLKSKNIKMLERKFSAINHALSTINVILDHYSKIENRR